jgi:vitamin B12 transporter
MKLLTFVLAFLLVSTTLVAQPPVISDEIVVTASAVPEQLDETPVAATVITREAIDRREARDVSDVLREVAGISVARTGTAGKVASLFVRGGSTKQALVLWNGVEMNNPYFSGYNFGQLSTAGVERIEVVRGPFSALYGSDAVSGVVNVLTAPQASGATLDVEAGEHGLLDAALHGALVRDSWSAYGTIERRRDEGFFARDDFAS